MADAFLDAFFAVDADGSQSITQDELEDYMRKNNYDQSFVTKWLRLFDSNNTGVITLHEFCHVLGLEVEDAIQHREKLVEKQVACLTGGKGPKGKWNLPEDVQILSVDMTENLQEKVIDLVLQARREHESERELVRAIKMQLDLQLDRLWHCIILTGSYWSYYSYEPGYSIIFKIRRHIFVIFRTPA